MKLIKQKKGNGYAIKLTAIENNIFLITIKTTKSEQGIPFRTEEEALIYFNRRSYQLN